MQLHLLYKNMYTLRLLYNITYSIKHIYLSVEPGHPCLYLRLRFFLTDYITTVALMSDR